MSSVDPIVIVSMARTPMGGFEGDFAGTSAAELGAAAIKAHHQAWIFFGSAMDPGPDAKGAMIPVDASRYRRQMWKTRIPHERAVTENP